MQLVLNCEQQNLEDSAEVKSLSLHVTQQQEATQTMWTWPSKDQEWKENQGHRGGEK